MCSSSSDIDWQELSEMSDQDLLSVCKTDLLARLRKEEAEKMTALLHRGRLITEVNNQLQEHLNEIRELKLVNNRLQEENQELRELCSFLDDDRMEIKTLSRKWQLFGQQAGKVMRKDLGGHLKKLADLERVQDGLVKDNFDLKELCLVLEESLCVSRGDSSPGGSSELSLPCLISRGLGDGSSSTGSIGGPDPLILVCSP